MTLIQKQFFALVQSGLWGAPIDAALFTSQTDWRQLYQSAVEQTLSGVVLDGIQHLPRELRPGRELYLRWCNALLQMEENNRFLNRKLAGVCALYRANGIEPVLLKGQGVAQHYLHPLHRHCGDIDLYIGRQHYEKANALLRQEASGECEETYKHTTVYWHGALVENHRLILRLNSPMADWRFQREAVRLLEKGACRITDIEGCRVLTPPLPFNVAYVLAHSALHFLNEGIGLRHLCDWANLLHDGKKEIDREETVRLLRQWGLSKAARIFGAIAVNYLGLPKEDLPVSYTPKDVEAGEWLLGEIWQGGNFGQHDLKVKRRPKGYWSGKWYTFVRAAKRCYDFGSLAPAEARWYPVMLAIHSAQVQWNIFCNKILKRKS